LKPMGKEYVIHGKRIICDHCRNEKFWNKRTLMNTPGMTLMGLEFLNKAAETYICTECGHVTWFMLVGEDRQKADLDELRLVDK